MRALTRSILCFGLALAGSAQAATVLFDFNSDPTAGGLSTLYGSANWNPTDGVGVATNANDGFLEITAAQNSLVGAIVFSDFDNGAIVGGVHLEADVRIGNGTSPPADGFCIAYVRSTDPILNDPTATGNYAATPDNSGQGPEEGSTTGIAVGFDAYQNSAQDLTGIDLRIDGKLVFFPLPTIDGALTDPTSIQTGPNDGTSSPDSLGWAHLIVDLTTNGILNVTYKGKLILTNYSTGYVPGPGRLLVAGRTGGLNENQDIDNVAITTITIPASVGPAVGAPDGFSFTINDSGPSVVNPSTVAFSLNGGAPLTANSVTKVGTVTTVTYHEFPTLLAAGSSNQINVSFKDTGGNTITGIRSFVVPAYSVFPASDAVASGVDTTAPGFKILPWESGVEPNAVYWANEQLSGLHGANNADLTTATDGGYIDYTGVINFNAGGLNEGGAGDNGDFQTSNGYPDAPFPGIPGANTLTGDSSLEAVTFVRFATAGVYTMGVNSDDGFAVNEGPDPRDRLSLMIGSFNGGRGSSDSLFTFVVPAAGIYPMRLMWENGDGELPGNGANLEWFVVQSNSVKILLNDPSPTNTTGVAAFYKGPALPPYVSQVIPYPGETGARPDYILLQLTDGGTTVNASSISLKVNGTAVTPTVSKAGSVTTLALTLDVAHLMSGGSNTASIAFGDTGSFKVTNSWSFTVEPFVTLDPSLSTTIASVNTNQPGFALAVTQLDPSTVGDAGDGLPTQIDSFNALLAGLYFPYYGTNTADTVGGGGFGTGANVSNVWYWTNAVDFNVSGSPGDFTLDYQLPGIPGTTGSLDNYATEFQSYIVFTNAGLYQMGVNSDDGFRVSEGVGVTRQVLHVTGPSIDTDVAAVVTDTNNDSYGALPPTVPISGPVVFVDVPCPNLPGPTNLTGKIGVIDYESCPSGFNVHDLAFNLQTDGAIAAIIINNPTFGLPFVGDGSGAPVTIPVLVVNGDFGQRLFWVNNSGLTATIGSDANLVIGQDDVGKGMSHVDFGFVVPKAGAYPLRLLYFQGGGGAGLEWTTVNPSLIADGNRVLINDTSTAGSLLAYRAAAVTALPKFNQPKYANGNITITWTGSGTLQQTPSLTPPAWTDVTPQPTGNTYTFPATGPGLFFRIK